jgi:hypothetical protein
MRRRTSRSLIRAENSLLGLKKFPVRPSREFGAQGTENTKKNLNEKSPQEADFAKIPCKIPC